MWLKHLGPQEGRLPLIMQIDPFKQQEPLKVGKEGQKGEGGASERPGMAVYTSYSGTQGAEAGGLL